MKKSLFSILVLSTLLASSVNAQYYEEYFVHPTSPNTEQLFDGFISNANPILTTNQPTVASTGYYKSVVTGSNLTLEKIRAIRTDAFGTPIFNHSYNVIINNVTVNSSGFSIAENKNLYVAVGTVRDAQLTPGGADILIMQIDPNTGNPIVTNKVDMESQADVANSIYASNTQGIFYICGENFNANFASPTSFIMRYNATTNNVDWIRRFRFQTTAGVQIPSSYYGVCEHTNGDVYAVGKLVVSATNTDGLVTKINATGGAAVHKSYHKTAFDEFRSIRRAVGFRNFVIGGNCKYTANDPNSVYLLWLDTAFNLSGQVLSTQYDWDYCYDAVERKNTLNQFEYFTAGKTRHNTATLADYEGSTFKYNLTTGVLANYLYGDTGNDNFYGIDYYSLGSPIDGITMFGQYSNTIGNSWHVKAYMNGLTNTNCQVELPTVSKIAIDFTVTARTPIAREIGKLDKINSTIDKHTVVFLCKGVNTAGSNALVHQVNDEITEKTPSVNPNELTLYPNPLNGNSTLNIVFELTQQSDVTIQLFDQMGRLLETSNLEAYNGANQTTLDMGHLPQGSYFVRLIGENINLTKKVVK